MTDKYLLYIDIVGFSSLVENGYDKIEKLFDCIDHLNVHMHNDFKTIVFSDTILIFNKTSPVRAADHEYIVMFLCEFAQNLLLRSAYLDVHFRAVLVYDSFSFQNLKNIDAYYGPALIKAYRKETTINAHGLFIDQALLKYNKVFSTSKFDEQYHFVYLTQNLDRLKQYGANWPIDPYFVEQSLEFTQLHREVKLLQMIKKNIEKIKDSKVRGRYLQTYYFYQLEYGELINNFEAVEFDYKIVSPGADWNTNDLF